MNYSGRLHSDSQAAHGSSRSVSRSRDSDISDCDSDIDIVGDPKPLGYTYKGT